jgi:hypothetical protein
LTSFVLSRTFNNSTVLSLSTLTLIRAALSESCARLASTGSRAPEGDVLHYTRTLEIKQPSVPVSQAEDLKKFYRIIASDERGAAVLKPASTSSTLR